MVKFGGSAWLSSGEIMVKFGGNIFAGFNGAFPLFRLILQRFSEVTVFGNKLASSLLLCLLLILYTLYDTCVTFL